MPPLGESGAAQGATQPPSWQPENSSLPHGLAWRGDLQQARSEHTLPSCSIAPLQEGIKLFGELMDNPLFLSYLDAQTSKVRDIDRLPGVLRAREGLPSMHAWAPASSHRSPHAAEQVPRLETLQAQETWSLPPS
jgi:hypothetical protein